MRSQPCYLCGVSRTDVSIQFKLSALPRGEAIWRDYQTDVISCCLECWNKIQRGEYQTDFIRVLPERP